MDEKIVDALDLIDMAIKGFIKGLEHIREIIHGIMWYFTWRGK